MSPALEAEKLSRAACRWPRREIEPSRCQGVTRFLTRDREPRAAASNFFRPTLTTLDQLFGFALGQPPRIFFTLLARFITRVREPSSSETRVCEPGTDFTDRNDIATISSHREAQVLGLQPKDGVLGLLGIGKLQQRGLSR